MKKIVYFFIAIIALSSCGDSKEKSIEALVSDGDLKAIRAKKAELSNSHKQLEAEITQLDRAIAKLDGRKNYPLVSTYEVKEKPFHHFLELQGNVMTKQNVLIYPEMPGTLLRVYVKEGQRVSKGQLLASIDDGGLGSQLNQLKTQLTLAKTTFERQKKLWDQKIGSEIQFLQAKATYEAQENAVKQLESQLGKSTIKAPFSGIIDDVIKEQGTVVAPGPGSEVFRIVNLLDMYISVDVPERYVGNVTKGKEVNVYFPVLGDSVVTKVRQTGNFINPDNRSFMVEIPVPNKNGTVKPNLSARVKINDYTNESALLIPQSIISENAEGNQYIYALTNKESDTIAEAKKMIITTGKTKGNYVEVLSGLNNGAYLIQEGARSVKDGQKVEIKK